MKLFTKVVLDIETGEQLEAESFEYSGPVAECKGGSGAKTEQGQADRIVGDLYDNGPLKPALYSVLNPTSQDEYAKLAGDKLLSQVRGGFGARGLTNSGIAIQQEQDQLSKLYADLTLGKEKAVLGALGSGGGGAQSTSSQSSGMFGK